MCILDSRGNARERMPVAASQAATNKATSNSRALTSKKNC